MIVDPSRKLGLLVPLESLDYQSGPNCSNINVGAAKDYLVARVAPKSAGQSSLSVLRLQFFMCRPRFQIGALCPYRNIVG